MGINVERNDYIKNSRDSPCLIDNVYIDDKYLPVGRSSVLVAADNWDNVIYLGITNNTDGDLTKNNNVDLIYDVIMWATLDIILTVQ